VRVYLGQGALYVVLGQVLGVGLALLFTSLIQGMLFRGAVFDPMVLLLASPLLALSVLVTCYLPARRAGTVDPLEALKA